MAELRENPYGNFNFLVELGAVDAESVQAGFTEVALPDARVDVYEYRNGNEKINSPRLVPGLVHYSNLTLKRGIIGALDLYEWFDEVRTGKQSAKRTVVVKLLSEDRSAVAMTWSLTRAIPVRYRFGDLDAKSREVAVEFLELAFEEMQVE